MAAASISSRHMFNAVQRASALHRARFDCSAAIPDTAEYVTRVRCPLAKP